MNVAMYSPFLCSCSRFLLASIEWCESAERSQRDQCQDCRSSRAAALPAAKGGFYAHEPVVIERSCPLCDASCSRCKCEERKS